MGKPSHVITLLNGFSYKGVGPIRDGAICERKRYVIGLTLMRVDFGFNSNRPVLNKDRF